MENTGRLSKRYAKNLQMLSEEEVLMLHSKKVCVLGCGGLGGYVVEMLGRLGIEAITVVDGDCFDESNLNRQLLATEDLIGVSKARAAQRRMASVNPRVSITVRETYLTEENAREIIAGHDLVFDALDSIGARKLAAGISGDMGIPLIYGAIAGWYAQVATIFPGEGTLESIYPGKQDKGREAILGNPSFTPALVAAVQVSEGLKVLLGRGEVLRNRMLFIDLLNNEFDILPLNGKIEP
ncbi:MAG: molybdopterin biosynthesis protein MoeB [delta proteobacterium ML8_F1]|nr:MAG: molybdopterin biosynthesis protein MoeB [delta proteobacterium ML8_F1]